MFNKIKNGTDSMKELALIYGISVIVVSLLFALFEGRSIADSVWWTFITGLTIGYGDIYPVTAAGQVLTVIWANFMMLFLAPLFVVRLVVKMYDDRNVFTHEEQEEMKSLLKQIANKK